MIVKPHSQCTAEELMNAISITVQDGVATLEYAEEEAPEAPEAPEPEETV